MKHEIISLEEVQIILKMYEKALFPLPTGNWQSIPAILGLKSIHPEESWMNSTKGKSFLCVVDRKKWLISKIKYGI